MSPLLPQGICNNQGRCKCGRCICDKTSLYTSSTCEISYSLVRLCMGPFGFLTSPSLGELLGKECRAGGDAMPCSSPAVLQLCGC